LDLGELDQLLLDMEGESLYGITDTQSKVRHTHTQNYDRCGSPARRAWIVPVVLVVLTASPVWSCV
jgi:hypothetical protein